MKRARSVLLVIVLLGILFGALQIYLHQFSSSPQGVVEDFFDAYNHSDVNGMAACMEPGTESLVSGSVDLVGSVLGAMTGVDLDLNALVDLLPALSDTEFDSTPHIEIENVQVIAYTPSSTFPPDVTEALVNAMPALVNLLAEDATVAFQLAGEDVSTTVEVIRYGSDGWRIPMDSDLFLDH